MSRLGEDALSLILQRLRLQAEVYVHADFCGAWVVDTSGSRKVPFHLIERGEGWLLMDDQTPVPLRAGHLVIFPHDHEHQLCSQPVKPLVEAINTPASEINDEPLTTLACGSFEFAGQAQWPLLDSLPAVVILDLTDLEQHQLTHQLMQLMLDELNRQAPGCKSVVDQLSAALFVHVLRSQLSDRLDQGVLAALSDPQIGKALTLIHQQPAENWTVERLAHEVGMSRSVFSGRFRALSGKTPVRYLTEWRMNEARDLLLHSDQSIAQIAEACGYQSEVAFRKAFRSVTGQTPGVVRRQSAE